MPLLERSRPVSLVIIVAFWVLHIAFNALNNLVLFNTGIYDPLMSATAGLINATLQANLLMILVLIGGVLVVWAKQRPHDLGLIWSGLPRALGLTVLVWVLAQGALALTASLNGYPIAIAPAWSQLGVTVVLGMLLGQVFGNALFEEISYRGFMLPQMYHKLRVSPPWLRVLAALLVSQALFALIHVPSWIASGQDILANVPRIVMLGVFFALFYVVTGDIFLSIGVHALGNRPTALVATPGVDPSLITLAVAALVLLVLWLWRRRSARMNTR